VAIADARPMAKSRALWSWIFGQPYLLLALTTLMWGGNAVAGRLAVGHISPMALTWLRWLAVCLMLAPFLIRQTAMVAPKLARRWPYLLAM